MSNIKKDFEKKRRGMRTGFEHGGNVTKVADMSTMNPNVVAGAIPGKSPQGVDDTSIDVRGGEYVVPQVAIKAFGGKKVMDAKVKDATGVAPNNSPGGLRVGADSQGFINGGSNPLIDLANQQQGQMLLSSGNPLSDLASQQTGRTLMSEKNPLSALANDQQKGFEAGGVAPEDERTRVGRAGQSTGPSMGPNFQRTLRQVKADEAANAADPNVSAASAAGKMIRGRSALLPAAYGDGVNAIIDTVTPSDATTTGLRDIGKSAVEFKNGLLGKSRAPVAEPVGATIADQSPVTTSASTVGAGSALTPAPELTNRVTIYPSAAPPQRGLGNPQPAQTQWTADREPANIAGLRRASKEYGNAVGGDLGAYAGARMFGKNIATMDSNNASRDSAQSQAASSRYAADVGADSHRYSADKSFEGQMKASELRSATDLTTAGLRARSEIAGRDAQASEHNATRIIDKIMKTTVGSDGKPDMGAAGIKLDMLNSLAGQYGVPIGALTPEHMRIVDDQYEISKARQKADTHWYSKTPPIDPNIINNAPTDLRSGLFGGQYARTASGTEIDMGDLSFQARQGVKSKYDALQKLRAAEAAKKAGK